MSLLHTKITHCKLALSNALLLSSLFLVNSCAVTQAVTQCGVLQLQKTAKPSIAVSNNKCTAPDMALGSIVYLQGDASVRLLSAARDQIICQNQSHYPLKIIVSSAASPWIRPEQDNIRCDDWLNSRLECNATLNNKKTLICAISESDNVIGLVRNLKKASAKMRSPKTRSPSPQPDDVSMEMEREKVNSVLKNYITPKIDQCRKNFPSDQTLTLAWIIKSNGVVIDTDIPENISEDKFVDCAVEVIEDWIFPPFQNDIPVTYEF